MRLLLQALLVAVIGGWIASAQDLWQLANDRRFAHRYSALFTAQDVRDYLSRDGGIDEAVAWCKESGITKVYLGAYRAKYRAEKKTLLRARNRFRDEGFAVAGVVTTTRLGKASTGQAIISCYTNQGTQTELREVVEYAAGIFGEIVIDDFWFTDCTCEECDRARRERQVRIRVETFPVATTSWEDYRAELMLQLSRSHIVAAAKKVNPRVRLIVKYPRWYDRLHERGYDVLRQTKVFDRIWAGTETRLRNTESHNMQYRAYFLMRWLGGIGGGKAGGGWFDPRQTVAKTYIEQARQTVLAGAQESVLATYGGLHQNFGPDDIDALRHHIPELLDVAAEVRRRKAVGVAAYKPPGSHPEDEPNVYDYVGMLGIPLAPTHVFPAGAPAAFFPIHASDDPDIVERLSAYIATGRPALITDGLARRLSRRGAFGAPNVHVLRVGGSPQSLLSMSQQDIDELRAPLLAPLGFKLRAPVDVSLYCFNDGSWVIENFSDQQATVELNGEAMIVGAREWVYQWK